MKFPFHTKCHAFTLIETIVVIALSVSIMITFGLLIYNFNTAVTYGQASVQSSDSANTILRGIELLTLPADAVLQTHEFLDGTATSSSTTLVLEIPSIDSSGNVIVNAYDYAKFYVIGTNAYLHLEANVLSSRISGTKQLGSDVNALTFIYNNSNFSQVNTVTVDAQTQVTVKQTIISDHLREQVRLRNY